jgi:hypothetical protein
MSLLDIRGDLVEDVFNAVKKAGHHLPLDATEPRLWCRCSMTTRGSGRRHGCAHLTCAAKGESWRLRAVWVLVWLANLRQAGCSFGGSGLGLDVPLSCGERIPRHVSPFVVGITLDSLLLRLRFRPAGAYPYSRTAGDQTLSCSQLMWAIERGPHSSRAGLITPAPARTGAGQCTSGGPFGS